MKYLKQFLIIIAISLIGEVLHALIPLPIPASIYGIIILFTCLVTKLIPLEKVRETGNFLVAIMPVMFIPAAVGLIDTWGVISGNLIKYILMTVITTVVVMAVTGLVTQAVIRIGTRRKKA